MLAEKSNVKIDYQVFDYETARFQPESFDCLVLIFAHMNPVKRREYHKKLASFLKPGGTLILEGFSKKQISNNTGGPRDVNMLFSEFELAGDFEGFSKLEIAETETQLSEGAFHKGEASVIRVLGVK